MATQIERVYRYETSTYASDPTRLVGFDRRSGVQWYYSLPDKFENDQTFEDEISSNPKLLRMIGEIHERKLEQQGKREAATELPTSADVTKAKPELPGLQRQPAEVA